jgi:hypothetical protein
LLAAQKVGHADFFFMARAENPRHCPASRPMNFR